MLIHNKNTLYNQNHCKTRLSELYGGGGGGGGGGNRNRMTYSEVLYGYIIFFRDQVIWLGFSTPPELKN